MAKSYAFRKRLAMSHSDKVGSGAAAREKHLKGKEKVGVVMSEYKRGTLHSGGSGNVVTNPKQAVAIAMSEAGLSKRKTNIRKKFAKSSK